MEQNIKHITKIQSCARGYIVRNKKVLEPCNIKELPIDITKLKNILLKDYLTESRIEYIESSSTHNISLEDKFMEFMTAKCISGDWVGDGHSPIDVVKDDKGIDVFCVCVIDNYTNEKSIMQNFETCGKNLDNLFDNGKYKEALSNYKKEYFKKLLIAKKTKNIKKIYYCGFISTNANVYMSVFKINLECIVNMTYESVTLQKKSIKFKGFINDKFGKTMLYKSKKRLEVRFHKDILNYSNTIKIF